MWLYPKHYGGHCMSFTEVWGLSTNSSATGHSLSLPKVLHKYTDHWGVTSNKQTAAFWTQSSRKPSSNVWLWVHWVSVLSCPHQCSISDVVLRVERASTGDGRLIQRVAVRLTAVLVDGEVLHVYRPLWLQRLHRVQKENVRRTI